jgi:hypothetical protein
MNTSHDFKTSSYFTGMPFIVGFILTPIGFILLFSPKIIIGGILLLAGIIILTTHFRVAIDKGKKEYSEYISLLGMKVSKELHSFDQIQYLFIKTKKVSQTLNSRASSRTIQKEMYDGYLKFSEDDKVHLMTFENKGALLKRLRPIARLLSTKIIDYTTENPIETN